MPGIFCKVPSQDVPSRVFSKKYAEMIIRARFNVGFLYYPELSEILTQFVLESHTNEILNLRRINLFL